MDGFFVSPREVGVQIGHVAAEDEGRADECEAGLWDEAESVSKKRFSKERLTT